MSVAAAAGPLDAVRDRSRSSRTLPPIAALLYPALVWAGPALGPIFLAVALSVPGLGLVAAHRARTTVYPRSRWIAFTVVAAPPLYSLLGGLLDFQNTVPFNGLHVWIVFWLLLACIAFFERPSESRATVSQSERLAFAHGISALMIASFAVLHLANHLSGLWGGARHIEFMTALRYVYRNPGVEILLLASIGFQIASGLRLLQRKAAGGGWIESLQTASAVYMVAFFASHLSAVFRARYLGQVDTNWNWLTSSNLLTDPWSARLTPYYFLAVVAFGVHAGAGVRRVLMVHRAGRRKADAVFYAAAAVACVLSSLILMGLLRGFGA